MVVIDFGGQYVLFSRRKKSSKIKNTDIDWIQVLRDLSTTSTDAIHCERQKKSCSRAGESTVGLGFRKEWPLFRPLMPKKRQSSKPECVTSRGVSDLAMNRWRAQEPPGGLLGFLSHLFKLGGGPGRCFGVVKWSRAARSSNYER